MSHGFHYTPCQHTRALPLLLIAGGIAAVVFWPTVTAVAATVVTVLKLVLLTGLAITLAGVAVAIGVAVRRHRRAQPNTSVLKVRPARPPVEPAVAEQLAALTAAVARLERDRQPALSAPARPIVIDQQALATLLAMASQRRELAEAGEAR